ncbi:hypothetical protein [Croceitalea rosinachiae]|uniref:Uncharacterized protein n=1 Tax=Croceitalea rosinachiae TaxID=3075596 RepID=A0ABU3A649_9FLAO|nr:hypothetical protein [Croceitalea sp. F388]MDT0605444.1 hypothetical protein [Croceitalea sp. F388]
MIASQRKSHKYVWLIIAIVIPVMLFFAIKDLDFSTTSNNSKKEQLTASFNHSKVQIQLRQPLQSPSPLVYELNANGKPGKILGQLNGIGNYKFSTSSTAKGIVVKDGIKNEELFKIEF